MKKSFSRLAFEIMNYTLFTMFCISIIVPFVNCIAISLSSTAEVTKGGIGLLPRGFNIGEYKALAGNMQFIRTFGNTVFLTVVNTVLVILIALAAGYALSNKHLPLKKVIIPFILIPMYFSGGLIPLYLLVNSMKLNNTYWALILPNVLSIYYILVFRNIIDQLPKEMTESAEIDGASQPTILANIIIPLIMPTIAAFIVFSAVGYWNEWFGCLIYIKKRTMWTLQYQLRDLLVNGRPTELQSQEPVSIENRKMAALMLTILPILAVYPFVQKYFMSGVLVGAVKG